MPLIYKAFASRASLGAPEFRKADAGVFNTLRQRLVQLLAGAVAAGFLLGGEPLPSAQSGVDEANIISVLIPAVALGNWFGANKPAPAVPDSH